MLAGTNFYVCSVLYLRTYTPYTRIAFSGPGYKYPQETSGAKIYTLKLESGVNLTGV